MLKIGLTGGIGSGKTTVSQLFAELGTPVIDADVIAHQLVEKDQPALNQLVSHFGQVILNSDKTLNRPYLSDLVFNDRQKKQKLEAILHPLVYETITSTVEKLKSDYCIICVPLLIETNMTSAVDRVLAVDCPIEVQIERVRNRDQLSLEKINTIIASQVSRTARITLADDLIDNSKSDSGLAEQVKKLHNLYLSLSKPG